MRATDEPVDVDTLPPTQYLVMEVLAARYRLGEQNWPFPRRLQSAVDALAKAGLAWSDAHPEPGQIRVWLTDTGRAEVLDEGHVPKAERDGRRKAAAEIRSHVSGLRLYPDAYVAGMRRAAEIAEGETDG